MIIHKPFVVIVATRNGSIALIRQYRYTLDRTTLEFPKGGIEKNERAQNAAHRELREELRSEANKLRYLGKLASNIGKSRCNCYVYHVLDPKHLPHPPPRDKTEQGMRIRWMPITRFREMIRRGEITDQDTLAAWALYSIQRDALAL